jgi:hypothetical protein
MYRLIYLSIGMATLLVVMSFHVKRNTESFGTLNIDIKHVVGNQVLKFDSVTYQNELGQNFTVTKFKYYISNIKLVAADNKVYLNPEVFFINEEDPLSKKIVLGNVPPGSYKSLQFIIGVDSARNCAGVQPGALDPVNAMYWAWNTGYVFLKLEGKSEKSVSPGNYFEYHIGGFRSPHNCIRHVDLDLHKDLILIEKDRSTGKELKCDISEILKTPNAIDFSKLSSVTDVNNASVIADNYSDMFSF